MVNLAKVGRSDTRRRLVIVLKGVQWVGFYLQDQPQCHHLEHVGAATTPSVQNLMHGVSVGFLEERFLL